jgi:hypothetical protein
MVGSIEAHFGKVLSIVVSENRSGHVPGVILVFATFVGVQKLEVVSDL